MLGSIRLTADSARVSSEDRVGDRSRAVPLQIPRLNSLTDADRATFARDGFLVVENALETAAIERLRAVFPRIFKGDFDTGVFPDEWHWREGVSLPDVTRHMANVWKSDLAIANLALSSDLGRMAAGMTGWPGVKLGQDTIWWKPPGTKAGTFHQDTAFLAFLNPARMLTCWFTLDDTRHGAGTIEYVRGSHKWPIAEIPDDFLSPEDYQQPMRHAAEAAGVSDPDIVPIEAPAGSCVIHAGEIWHGSGVNRSSQDMRRSVGVHMIPENAVFTDRHGGYIYRRYQHTGSNRLDESFFPILFSKSGKRTDWIAHYCETGRRQSAAA